MSTFIMYKYDKNVYYVNEKNNVKMLVDEKSIKKGWFE